MVLMAAAVGVTVAIKTGTMVVTSMMVMVEVLAEALMDVVVSSGMILSFQKARFSCFLKKRNGHTDGRTYGRTYGHTDGRTVPLIEMR